jgi:hypothetical protein
MARINNFNSKESFTFYKSFDDYMAFVDKTFAKVPRNYDSFKGVMSGWTDPDRDFVGSDNVAELNGKLKDFIDPQSLDVAIQQISNLFSLINLGGAFAKDRMVATDLPIGVFDFSLASKGLYKAQEYFCEGLNKVIAPDLVRKLPTGENTFIYTEYKDGIPTTYNVIQQQEGTHEINLKNDFISELLKKGITESEAIIQATEKFPRAKLIFRTTTKKVNLIRKSKTLKENQEGNEKYVDLFIAIGGLWNQTPRSLMYKTMPCLLVAYFMDKAGIKTRILGLDAGTEMQFNDTTKRDLKRFVNSFVIKNYEDGFDFNELAILTADSRVFRWKLFKAIMSQFYDKFNHDIGSGLGSNIIGQAFLDTFERYKTFYIEKQKTEAGVKNQNSRLMFASEVTPDPKWDDDRMMEMVEEEFFRIIDAIDIEFNGAKTALPRIKEREVTRGMDLSNLRQRLVGTVNLATSYDESDSPYSASDKTIAERLAKRQKLTQDVNTVIQTI